MRPGKPPGPTRTQQSLLRLAPLVLGASPTLDGWEEEGMQRSSIVASVSVLLVALLVSGVAAFPLGSAANARAASTGTPGLTAGSPSLSVAMSGMFSQPVGGG